MANHDATVNAIFDDLCEAGKTSDSVTLGQLMEAMGHRGFGPFLIVPAFIEISPIGGIPGVPTLLACIIALFAAQIAMGHHHMWSPQLLKRQGIRSKTLHNALSKMRPVADWLDKWFHGRLKGFAGPVATRMAAFFVLALCLTVPFLEFVPFASTAPMAAIALVGLAITVRDGALMLAALTVAVIGLGLALSISLGGAWG